MHRACVHNVGMLAKVSPTKTLAALSFVFAAASAFVIDSDELFCCRYAATNEHCHATCTEIFRTHNPDYLEVLKIHFPENCPKRDLQLREFWNCIGGYNDTSGWVGRRCCEDTVDDECRRACIKSHSKDDLVARCRDDYEDSMYKCIFREESRQSCCGKRTGMPSSCRHHCEVSFGRETGPTSEDIVKVTNACGKTMGQCMQEYRNATKQTSIVRLPCCDRASDQACRRSCKEILRSGTSDRSIVDRLVDACGDVMPHKPLWKCFLKDDRDPTTPSPSPPSLPKLMCCDKALSETCMKLCKQVHANPWPQAGIWKHFQNQCEYNTAEIEMTRCLQEVDSPCKMGCSGMAFCSNFNNRPTDLFRSCDVEGDEIARESFKDWTYGRIRLLNVELPVKDIQQCEPEKWKAVACALQIKPCGSRSGESIICRSDCVSLLNKCADKERMFPNANVEEMCDLFSPPDLQSNCITLSAYTKPAQALRADVTQPCLSNPCPEGKVCVVNRRPCPEDGSCAKHSCLQGCKMGHGSSFVVPYGSLVRVPDPSRDSGCFKACTCALSGALRDCTALPCTDKHEDCEVAGQLKHHGDNFFVDCNFCSCYSGIVTCTKRQCSSVKVPDKRKAAPSGMPCNCSPTYIPVCGSNGRTFPNRCVAECLGSYLNSTRSGPCSKKNPCHPNPCGEKHRCVPTPRVCLTRFEDCQQYECLPRYRPCSRILQNPLTRLSRRSKHPRHVHRRYGKQSEVVKEVLASSYFFSHGAFLEKNDLVCDENNRQFDNVCKLLRSKQRTFAHKGSCKSECSKETSRPVCGHDRVTYNNSCIAEAIGVLVDHYGACESVGMAAETKDGTACKGVTCPALASKKCKAILPPGSCCPLCGGMIRVILSKTHLNAVVDSVWKGPVSVRDIVWLLRSRLNVLECKLYGQLTVEGDLAILVVSTLKNPSPIQVEACSREAERLSKLINTRNPTLTSYLILSPLTASTLSTSDRGSAATSPHMTSRMCFAMTMLTFLHWWLSDGDVTR